MIEWFEGICMMCHESPVKVRHVALYVIGSEGLFCCKKCEEKLLEFIRKKSREAVIKKIETIRKLKTRRKIK